MALQVVNVIAGVFFALFGIKAGYKIITSLTTVPHGLMDSKVTSINLDDNSIKVLGDNEFSKYTLLSSVSMKSNLIDNVHLTAFDNTVLKDLNLHRNNLKYIPNLSGVTDTLTRLDLSKNKIQQGTSSFDLDNLKMLKIKDNKLTSFPDLPGAATIMNLDISQNQIGQKNIDKIQAFQSLETLKMQCTGQIIFPYLDQLNDTLTSLDLSRNQLTDIGVKNVNYLTSLTILKLDNNNIAILPSLHGLASLEQLYMRNNRLTGSGLESLNQLRKMKQLDLSQNPMITWPDLSYCGIHASFSRLDMNMITTLPHLENCTFCHFRQFAMRDSELTNYPDFSSCASHPSIQLSYIYLERNQLGDTANESLLMELSCIKLNIRLDDNVYTYFPSFPLELLNSLHLLTLNRNSISQFDPAYLYSMSNHVWKITMVDNDLMELPHGLLAVTSLLELKQNAIASLNALEMNRALCRNRLLRTIDLSYNDIGSLYQFPNLRESLCQDAAVNFRHRKVPPEETYVIVKGVRLLNINFLYGNKLCFQIYFRNSFFFS